MARKLRVQYPAGLYAVINRGNDRADGFASAGAANALDRTLADASERHGWRVLWIGTSHRPTREKSKQAAGA